MGKSKGNCFDYIDIGGCFVLNGLKSLLLMVARLLCDGFALIPIPKDSYHVCLNDLVMLVSLN